MQMSTSQICMHAFYLKQGWFPHFRHLNIYINETTFISQGKVTARFFCKTLE